MAMRTLIKGEKRYIAMTVVHKGSESFTISACTYTVKNRSGTEIETGAATIEGTKIFMLLDTTQEDYVADQTYFVYFEATVAGLPKTIIDKVEVKVNRW